MDATFNPRHLSGMTPGQTASPVRPFRFSGALAPSDQTHRATGDPDTVIAPIKVPIPGGRVVPQYAPTVTGNDVFDPAHDANGNFTSAKFQANNNCYNYATDVATNSFAQPGRKHGLILDGTMTGATVEKGAEEDGLIEVSEKPLSMEELAAKKKDLPPGHFVALVMSAPDPATGWTGDYHWVRQDQDGTWSQKDGPDQVTNFDFAGNKITDPAKANWVVNQGPLDDKSPNDVVAGYKFFSYMYAPDGKVDII